MTGRTAADFWTAAISDATWRTAREPHQCMRQRHAAEGPCLTSGTSQPAIQPGDRYFDTGEHGGTGSPHATYRLCEACAESEVVR